MKTLKSLLEEIRAFNMDTDEELDLDSLANIDIDSLLGDGYLDAEDSEVQPIDFDNLEQMLSMTLGGGEDDTFDTADGMGEEGVDGFNVDDAEGGEESPIDFDFDVNVNQDEENQEQQDFDNMSQDQADDIAEDDPDALDQDDDFQGEIRTVRGANLIFKRKMEDGNFEELWIYNVGNDIKRETQIRRAILAGTDVDPGSQESKDGSQRADTSTLGNVQFLHIVGLPQ